MAITFGLKTNTHVYIVSETTLAESIIKIKEDENTTAKIGSVLLSVTGDQADAFRTRSFVSQSTKLQALSYKENITPGMVARIMAAHVHEKLRSRPVEVQGIIGGITSCKTPELYSVDKYGAMHGENFVVTGYGLYFLFGIFDLYYKPVMSEEEAQQLIMNCLKVIKERLVLETNKWRVDTIGLGGMSLNFVDLSK